MTKTPSPTVVWTEIPVRDIDSAIAFYNEVFRYDMKRDDSGPNPMADLADPKNGVAGHLYPGKPAARGTGATIHLNVPDTLEATAERCRDAGGKVVSDAIPLPVGRFLYAEDPDGNSIGLFEASAS